MAMKTVSARVADLLTSVTSPGARNIITSEDVRTWLRALLADYAEEFADTPVRLDTQPLWDLIAADADPVERAMFVAVVVQGNEVRLLAGRGTAADVRAFGDSEFPEDAAATLEALRARFPVASNSLTLPRNDVSRWLQEAGSA